ncbi:MAG TPA: NADH-quinone oxidoreductase subunit H [Candidatus Eisenbacteria bacterium]|nr:NADH-quinone oxidoreductase subunit H [Candidatus Eisenbacteria bacterium]
MTSLESLVRIFVWILAAPLLPGIITKVKAWAAGRRGPPVLQPYYDLARLWKKGVVLSTAVSPWHVAGPAVAWVALAVAALLMPAGPAGAPLSFQGDALLFLYLLALARFATTGAALDTGSAFEGMGAAREVSFAVLTEAAVITSLLAMSYRTGSLSLEAMLAPASGPGVALLGGGLFLVLLAENSRVPFDDPNTHLELTMVHEVMVLDHSGPPLAVIQHGAALRLAIFAVLLVQVIWPVGTMPAIPAVLVFGVSVIAVAVGVGLVESLMARLAFRRVPLFLTTAFLLCLFALLVVWNGRHA